MRISPSLVDTSWVTPAERPLREGRDGTQSIAAEADYRGTAQTQTHLSFARNTAACIASDLTISNVQFPGKVAARERACAGL